MAETVSTQKEKRFRVLNLEAANVKRLRAIDVTVDPKAPLVIVGGNNGEGKSSTLDCILYALGGKDAVCADPLRHGQKKGFTRVTIGDYVVTRRFTPTGQVLELKTKEGLNVPSPQGFLDSLAGVLNFDPLAFSRMAPAKRLATLISLVKLDIDLADLATKRKALFDSRTDLSRRKRDFEGDLRQTPEPDASLPAEKIDVSALVAEKSRLAVIAKANDLVRSECAQKRVKMESSARAVSQFESEVERLTEALRYAQKALDEARGEHQGAVNAHRLATFDVEQLADPDTSLIDAQISEASDINTKIERAAEYRSKQSKLATMEKQYEQLSESIEQLDQAKEDALSRAEFPIPGLSFADGDVSFNGTLYDQLSSAEQTKVALAMAMAMNPALRVILIKDGSLLDETSMGIIREMAETRDYQVWVEVVGNRQDATLIIEDGAVVGAGEVDEQEPAEVANA